MNNRTSKFLNPIRSIADLTGIEAMRQAVNSLLNGQLIGGEIIYSDSNVVYNPSSKKSTVVNNFQIYNIGNSTDETKSNSTFQIRPGIIGFRPSLFSSSGIGISGISDLINRVVANCEVPLIGCGTDDTFFNLTPMTFPKISRSASFGADFLSNSAPSKNAGDSIVLPSDGSPILICDNSYLTPTPAGVQIVVPNIATGVGFMADFWILIKEDSTNGAYTELWGRSAPSLPNAPYSPAGMFTGDKAKMMIYLGVIIFDDDGSFQIFQTQSGNLLNRYCQKTPFTDSSSGNSFRYVPQNFRGQWSGVPSSVDLGTGDTVKIFYPGDVVIDDTAQFPFASGAGVSAEFFSKSFILVSKVPVAIQSVAGFGGGAWPQYGFNYSHTF